MDCVEVRKVCVIRSTGSALVCPESVQSPCPRSTVPSRCDACTRQQRGHHAPVDQSLCRSEVTSAISASSLLIPKAAAGSGIPARRQPVKQHFLRGSAASRCGDVSQSQGIHGYMAMVSPIVTDLQPIQRCGHMQRRARENLRGGHIQESLCRQRSSAAAFITHIADLVPGSAFKVRLQAFTTESGLAQFKAFTLPVFGDDPAKTCLDKVFHGCMFLPGKLARLIKKGIRYLYGRLHMANNIIRYGRMSRWREARVTNYNPAVQCLTMKSYFIGYPAGKYMSET